MHNILIISGTRPEIIKLAPVYQELMKASWARVEWLHTGQHGDMATQILDCFDVVPDRTLIRSGTSLQEFATGCRQQLEAVMEQRNWSLVIVQGDTESAFQGALAAFYHRVPLAHVEAGLRTYNLGRPFPEEGLRQMISRLARHHFAPTQRACDALRSEGIAHDKVQLTGNTVVDAQHWAVNHRGIKRTAQGRGHILVTVHRREHWGFEMEEIFHAVAEIAREHTTAQIVFPVHLNPVVQKAAQTILSGIDNVKLIAPMNYLEMQEALVNASLVLTDSGGLQEEAPTFGVPVLVLREETERPEAVEAGCAAVVGPGRAAIVREVRRLFHDELAYRRMQQPANPYGDGQASRRIVETLATHLLGKAPAVAVA